MTKVELQLLQYLDEMYEACGEEVVQSCQFYLKGFGDRGSYEKEAEKHRDELLAALKEIRDYKEPNQQTSPLITARVLSRIAKEAIKKHGD